MSMVRIATASFLMEDSVHSIERNLERAAQYIQDAGSVGAQIVLLPETVTTNGSANPFDHLTQSHHWRQFFADVAKENNVAVIAPFFVQEGDGAFNQATVFSSTGEVLGYYRKVQPTGLEARQVTPGSDFPVIDVGFARVAIMICMDIYFPEIARIYAMKGADILLWPTTTHGPTQQGLEAQLRSRAIDNSLWIVESNLAGHPPYAPYSGRFYPGNARVVDFNGDTIAQTGRRGGLAVCDIDLSERRTTQDVILINSPDDTRADLEALVRLDLYAKEYASLAERHRRFYDEIKR
jgi:predicted amidohydrolase